MSAQFAPETSSNAPPTFATDEGTSRHPALLWAVSAIFFVSGFPALTYQLVWQRSLFTIYGVNIESITVVVAAFMLGLGLGSLGGGILSRRAGLPALLVFGVCEVVIAAFGFGSLGLFSAVAEWTLGSGLFLTGVYSFLLVLVPTLLMGATLPILTGYLVSLSGNVGRSVGLLYFVNTLGSAVACFATALFLMGRWGMQGTVTFAALVNVTVGAAAVAVHFLLPREPRPLPRKPGESEIPVSHIQRRAGHPPVPFRMALFLSGAAGFVALSYEILWSRAFGFVSEGRATSFPFLLGSYLIGIALGSLGVRPFCSTQAARHPTQGLQVLGILVLAINVAGFFLIPAVAEWSTRAHYYGSLGLVTLLSAGLGATFPLISHLGISPGPNSGSQLSFLYLANIIGSTAGSLLTGFVLLDHLSLRRVSLTIALLGLILAGFLFSRHPVVGRRVLGIGWTFLLGFGLFAQEKATFVDVYEKLQFKETYQQNKPFLDLVETKSGVISVGTDMRIYGGGKYDGRFSTSLVYDSNAIVRAYSLGAFHKAPRQVLMIGLSSGSWAQVVAHHPEVDSLTIVEINPGYEKLIAKYDEVKSVLENPKVEVVIDDGRRWLARHPAAKFDLIVMNTSYNWRGQMSNLLSREFHALAKKHLMPGGILYFNTTDSEEVQRTGALSFPHAIRFVNFLMVSESPLTPDKARLRNQLENYRIDGKPVFDLSQVHDQTRLEDVLKILDTYGSDNPPALGIETRDQILARTKGFPIVTDDNMGTEWNEEYLY